MPQLAPSSSSSSSRPLRSHRTSLPWDVLAQIFQEADASTLALLGRVSLDFLVATSGLLYKNVEVTSLKQVEKLFCKREHQQVSPSSRINPHLDLSQISTLFLNFAAAPWLSPLPVSLPLSVSLARLSQSASYLLLDSLRLTCLPNRPYILETLYTLLLPLLNPVRFQHEIVERSTYQSAHDYLVPAPPRLNGWNRLKSVEIKGQLLLCDHLLVLPSVPPANLSDVWVCRIHLATLISRYSRQYTIEDVVRISQGVIDGQMAGRVVLVVRNEEEKSEVEGAEVSGWWAVPEVVMEA